MNTNPEGRLPQDPAAVPPTVISVLQEKPELSGVSVGLRIPPIWRDKLRGWFAHFEAIMKSQKKGDQAMYELVLGQLERQDVDEIYDILLRPPEENKYNAIKQRLLQVYEDSEQKNVQRVIAGMELGDLKPSQLLRRMQNLAGDHLSAVTLRAMWLNQLPAYVSSIIAISENTSLSEIALMADKMMDLHTQREISAINHRQHLPPAAQQQEVFAIDRPHSSSSRYNALEDKIDKLTEAITQLVTHNNQRGRSPYRNWRQNRQTSRSNSRNRSQTPSNSPYCYYHRKFGHNARKCADNCTFMKKNLPEN
ncbi:uncharacterized protein LOC114353367 [Ostrinia furnacalis]|uniref:uncharacterized protein LOC114353367 n=1 Tax=Ostrinia furnacalis TaxID=93504 RepID=UPI00103B5BA0|nr:uncharacterized protein LOC114353367 [Ostrinia furnacalis]